MKTLVIGDLHGQKNLAEKAIDTGYPVIFVGDYVDSFNKDAVACIETLKFVLESIESGKAQGLLGNHEMSYIDDSMRCSGYNPLTHNMIRHLDISSLKSYMYAEGFLITHAGISQNLLNSNHINLDEYLLKEDYNQIGRSRGGSSLCGGLYWCDWSEFDPVEGVDQIVGHSRGKDIREKSNNFCIDVLEDSNPRGLLIEDGVAEILEL